MAIRERKVKNKRNSQGILTGRPGIVYDVNVKVYENGKQKSIAKRGFATHREAELYEAQIKLELQTGSAAMVGYGPESKQKLKEYLPKWYESYHHNLAKSTRYSYWSGISIVQGVLAGLRPAVIAMIASAGISLMILALYGQRTLPADLSSFDLMALVIFLAGFFVLRKWKPSPIKVMAGAAVAGVVLYSITA